MLWDRAWDLSNLGKAKKLPIRGRQCLNIPVCT